MHLYHYSFWSPVAAMSCSSEQLTLEQLPSRGCPKLGPPTNCWATFPEMPTVFVTGANIQRSVQAQSKPITPDLHVQARRSCGTTCRRTRRGLMQSGCQTSTCCSSLPSSLIWTWLTWRSSSKLSRHARPCPRATPSLLIPSPSSNSHMFSGWQPATGTRLSHSTVEPSSCH